MSLFILAGIIALLFVGFGGYLGFSNPSGKGYLPGAGIGLIILVLVLVLVMGGI